MIYETYAFLRFQFIYIFREYSSITVYSVFPHFQWSNYICQLECLPCMFNKRQNFGIKCERFRYFTMDDTVKFAYHEHFRSWAKIPVLAAASPIQAEL